MIKTTFMGFMALVIMAAAPAQAALEVGQKAPDFIAVDTDGIKRQLSDLQGKTVVLEWTNHECPYVIKHYDTQNMQQLQKEALADDDIVWVTLVSSAPGKQGYIDAAASQDILKNNGATPSFKILDSSGDIGKLYHAKTTPHMFVIDKDGTLVYEGAIDDNPSARHGTVEGANNYVRAALQSQKNGEAIEVAQTKPYGCAIKY